jgi:ribonuclease J
MTSPDIISRGFIYLRDSEELMGVIRQYLKQKVSRTFNGRRVDLDVVKKEIKDELTHILYDQTRRTPIVIPVINEIGGGGGGKPQQGPREAGDNGPTHQNNAPQHNQNANNNGPANSNNNGPRPFRRPVPKTFPAPQVPDTDAIEPRNRPESRGY